MSKLKPEHPRYGPWLTGVRPRINNKSYKIGGEGRKHFPTLNVNMKTWKDVMSYVKGRKQNHTSSGHTYRSGYSGMKGNWLKDTLKQHAVESSSMNYQGSIAENQKSQSTTQESPFDLNKLPDEEGQLMLQSSYPDLDLNLNMFAIPN